MLLPTVFSKSIQHILSLGTLLAITLQSKPVLAQEDVKTMIGTIEAPQKAGDGELGCPITSNAPDRGARDPHEPICFNCNPPVKSSHA